MIHWVRGVCAGGICAVAMVFCAIGCGSGVEEMGAAKDTPPPPSAEEEKNFMKESMEKGGIKGKMPKGD